MDPIVGMEDEDPGVRLEVGDLRGACIVRTVVRNLAASNTLPPVRTAAISNNFSPRISYILLLRNIRNNLRPVF